MLKIYHNDNCSKSRAALAFLKEKGISYEIIDYLNNPPTRHELINILNMLNKAPIELVRINELVYKLNYANKSFEADEWIDIMIANPILIERPIVVFNQKAAIGRPLQDVIDLLIENNYF